MIINSREKKVFEDRMDKVESALRSFTFDEATWISNYLMPHATVGVPPKQKFTGKDILWKIKKNTDIPNPHMYRRSLMEFLQKLVTAGVLTEINIREISTSMPEERMFQGVWEPTVTEWAIGMAAKALGIPYVAHVYRDIVVKVHGSDSQGNERMGSGVVINRNRILTNSHVVRDKSNLQVSWGQQPPQAVNNVCMHPNEKIDIAILDVEGFEASPFPWMRSPLSAEPIVVLAYPFVPRVETRPLLRFTGHVSTDEPITTYYGEEQVIVSAVMGPGASGGPVFSADGYLVGIVVQNLMQLESGDSGIVQPSIFHAVIPSNVLQREIALLQPELKI